MKHFRYIFLSTLVALSFQGTYADGLFRLSKKDKQDLGDIMRDPIEQINKAIGQLNAYAQQVQVINNDVNVHAEINGLKHLGEKILAELHEIDGKLDQAFQQIAILRILVGNPDDPSVDPAQFDSVQAIDDAKLPLYVWSKTITRAIIEGNIVS
jgi:hypothetical protein